MKKRILSILLCLVMVVGLLPTAAMAEGTEPTTRTEKPAAEKIKFYNEDGTKVVKTLKNGQTYTIGDKVVAEYKDNVLTLNGYNGGPIEAYHGSLTMEVKGTNTVTSNGAYDAIAVTFANGDYEADGPMYSLTVTGKGTDPSIQFNLNSNAEDISSHDNNRRYEAEQSCFWVWTSRIGHSNVTIKDLTITDSRSDEYSPATLGIVNTLENCQVTLNHCYAAIASVKKCTLTLGGYLDTTVERYYGVGGNIENSTVSASIVCAVNVKDSTITAKYLRKDLFSYLYSWANTSNTYDWSYLGVASEDVLTIDNSTVTLTGASTSAWSMDDAPAIEDFYYDLPNHTSINEAGIVIRNGSKVTIKNHTYGIISPMRGVSIDKSNVTVEALSVAIGDLGTQSYGYGRGQNRYGLKVSGNSQVTLTAKEPGTAASNIASRYGTMALGYVQGGAYTPANEFDLTAGGFVQLTTDAFNRVPAAEFPATLGSQTKVVDGAYDGDYVVATKKDATYDAYDPVKKVNADVYTYTARIEGIKPAMTGEIKYQGVAQFDQQITAVATVNPDAAATGLKYKWQVKDGDTWRDISDANTAKLNIWNHVEVGDTIRAVAYADNYDGQIIGAAKTVEKSLVNGVPATPNLTFNLIEGDQAEVKIQNYDTKYEYVYTTSPATTTWPSSGEAVTNETFTVDQDTNPKTIYVYARFAETASSEAGTQFAGSSVLIPAKSGSTTYALDMIYPEYGTKTPTIYLKKGDFITVKYQITPDTATDGLPQWKDSYTSVDGKDATATVSNNTTNNTLTITAGNTVGTVYVEAYKNKDAAYPEKWTYGSGGDSAAGRQITVMIYDPSDLANAPFSKTSLGTVKLYEGDTYDVEMSDLLALNFVPAGVNKEDYTLAARITTYGGAGSITFADSNDYVELRNLEDAFRITAKKETTSNIDIKFFALPAADTEINSTKYEFATLKVSVSERPTVALESIKVAPNALTLRVDEEFTLSDTKTPAAADGTIIWSSSDASIVAVDSSTGKITAKAVGNATITATCGSKTATCTVEVIAKECTTHTKTYTYSSSDTHLWTCTACGAYGSEKHTGNWTSNGDDTHSITCDSCTIPDDKKTEAHNWVQNGDTVPAQVGVAGRTDYKCSKCSATKSDEIPALVGIGSVALTVTAPAAGGKASAATTTATDCNVAMTEWLEGENDVYIDDTFETGKTYTVKVNLEATGNNVFTDSTTFTVNSQSATIVSRGADSVTLTYTFPAIGGSTGKLTQTITAADVTATYHDTGVKINATAQTTLSYAVKGTSDVIEVDGTTGALTIKKAGTATVTVTAEATSAYNSATKDVTVTINPKALTIVSATAKPRDYQQGVKTVEMLSVQFYGESFAPTLIEATGVMDDDTAGTDKVVHVTVTLKGDAANNYTLAVNTYDTKVTINKIDPTAPTGLTGKTGDKLSTVTLPTGWTWDAPDTVLAKGEQTYKASYAGSTNYHSATNVDVTVTVTDRPSTGGGSYTPTYTITVEDAKHGDVKADRKSASSGTTVTITVDPDKGYDLETLTVLDKNGKEVNLTNKGSSKYTFKMPASKVTVKATFAEDNSMLNFFVDVPTDAYFADAVLWAAENGITGGIDAVHFAPYATCTRAQAVTFLWRAAGSPAPKSTEMPFADVKADSYYYNAVLWAVENGITKGISTTTFSPDVECSRAQIVTFLWRSQKSPVVSAVNPFTDVKVDAYYTDAVLWAAANGITGGTSATTFSPDMDCTRAQIVTFIYRCMK